MCLYMHLKKIPGGGKTERESDKEKMLTKKSASVASTKCKHKHLCSNTLAHAHTHTHMCTLKAHASSKQIMMQFLNSLHATLYTTCVSHSIQLFIVHFAHSLITLTVKTHSVE